MEPDPGRPSYSSRAPRAELVNEQYCMCIACAKLGVPRVASDDRSIKAGLWRCCRMEQHLLASKVMLRDAISDVKTATR